MQRFTHAIRAAVNTENWFAALFLALAMPDICGALEDPNAKVAPRYKNWFMRYMKQKYDPANLFELIAATSHQSLESMSTEIIHSLMSLPPNRECAFTADDCYRFRCKCLHQGLAYKMNDEKIHFTIPDKAGLVTLHMCSIGGLYQIQIDIFCLDICEAVECWVTDVSANNDIHTRMNDLIEIYDLSDPRRPIVKYQ